MINVIAKIIFMFQKEFVVCNEYDFEIYKAEYS